jgi:type II secretory ATPase GspE/PulE/Tfp pilus assembly ATPase PilB-like protein
MALLPEDHQSYTASPDAPGADITPQVDLNQMFVLIEGILPFEACLYYQVLPLSIAGSCLNLGMVNTDDQAAADYVRRLVSYINCSIQPRKIASDWHREILSKYLSHAAKNRPSGTPAPDTVASPPHTADPPSSVTNQPDQSPSHSHFQEYPTLVVNAPADLEEDSPGDHPSASKSDHPTTPPPSVTTDKLPTAPAHQNPPPVVTVTPDAASRRSNPAPPPINLDLQPLPHDHNQALQALSPKELTQRLLSRVIREGIGRLYLERQADFGRILWSKDGVLQSVIDEVNSQVFQGVINELKLLMNLSLIPIRKAKQVEIERTYEGHRILLRLRVMPGNYGEEATLQILRGAALKFYQQQQIEKLGRDALGIAHTLQQRLTEIREQARRNLNLESAQSETFPALISLLKQMEEQIDDLMS